MSRRFLLVLAAGLVVSACAVPLGRTLPECDNVATSVVMEVQSVPGSAFVSCIRGLKTGWSYQHLEARSGRSVYWLDSDRLGEDFVTVENLLSCDVGSAVESEVEGLPMQLFKDVVSETTVDVVIVPEGSTATTRIYAVEVMAGLDGAEIKGRTIAVSISTSDGETAARVSSAASTGAHVITVSVRDSEEKTLTLMLSGDPLDYEGRLDQVIDAIDDVETQSSYRGKWYFVFDGGCVVYTFDAEGSGVETLEDDIDLTLGFSDANAFRKLARDAGYSLP